MKNYDNYEIIHSLHRIYKDVEDVKKNYYYCFESATSEFAHLRQKRDKLSEEKQYQDEVSYLIVKKIEKLCTEMCDDEVKISVKSNGFYEDYKIYMSFYFPILEKGVKNVLNKRGLIIDQEYWKVDKIQKIDFTKFNKKNTNQVINLVKNSVKRFVSLYKEIRCMEENYNKKFFKLKI